MAFRAADLLRWGALLTLVGMAGGCATPSLESARQNFYTGHPPKAAQILAEARPLAKDRVLFLMERGLIRQAAADYEQSAHDFNEAAALLEELQTYSVSKGAASWVVNDGVQSFRGTPYERTLLHAFAAKNYLALGAWEDAAVEARRIIRSLEPDLRGHYPEDAYSRYMAGFCLEMIDDHDNAALEYRKSSALLRGLSVDETGHLQPTDPMAQEMPAAAEESRPAELVVFVLIGRAPPGSAHWSESWVAGPAAYADIQVRGKRLGRSYPLTDVVELAFLTEKLEALRKTAKSVGRVALKEAIAQAVENKNNQWMGDLVRLVLIGFLEQPDVRRWETLPRWLQVARVPCPSDLTDFDVIFKSPGGRTLRTRHVTQPLSRRRNTFVSFCRDLPP